MMKRKKLLTLFAVITAVTATASAGVIFTESFEEPDIADQWVIKGYNQDGPWPGWIGEGIKYVGVLDKSINEVGNEQFINSFGDQIAYVFNSIPEGNTYARLTTTADSLDTPLKANTTYTLKFNTASEKGTQVEYHVQLMAISDLGTETVLSEVRVPIASNDLAANPVSFAYRSGDTPPNLGERIAVRLRKGAGLWENNIFYDNISLSSDAMNVSPYDGEIVPGGIVDLSWTNYDPNVGSTVWVDVWVGTDPCDIKGINSQKILSEAQNATSTQFTANAGTTYYWQIVSYLNGDSVTDPCESDIFSFTTSSDLPPQTVDILTPDMVTWSGEPVSLNSEVIDDGASELTLNWTSIPADGVVFSPNASDPNPTITITKPFGFSVLPVDNSGFEDPRDAGDGNGFVPYPDGDRDYRGHLKKYTWVFPNWGYQFNGYCGVLNPTTEAYSDPIPEGENVGFVQSAVSSTDPYYDASGGLNISTISDLKPNTSYTLRVKVGNPLFNDAFPGYRIDLIAGGSLIARDANSLTIEPGTFETAELTYTSGEIVEPGQKLEIRLVALMSDHVTDLDIGDDSVYEVHFDDVQLLSDGDSTYAITLTVKDRSNPAKKDTMTIDVFDTACQATVIGMEITGDGDADGNCLVDMNDFQGMAATWLIDHTLSETALTPDGDDGNPVDPNSADTMINAGPDILTWSGQPVLLEGTIINDANTPQWTADQASLDDVNLDISITNANSQNASVVITKTSPTTGPTSVTLTLAVSGVEDSMVIDVYDDNCTAAVGLDPLVLDPADFNTDCKTNIEDLALMAAKWLSESTITEPGIKP